MTITASRNGTPQRKQLSDQLDRLDGIIDTLADGLTEAVSEAVKAGTTAALQQVLLDIVNNPTTRNLLRQTLAPEATPTPTAETAAASEAPLHTRKASFLARCRRAVGSAARKVAALPGRFVAGVKGLVLKTKGMARRLNIAWQLKKAVMVGLGIGVAVAAVAMVSHPLASILSGVGAAATAFAVQLVLWCRGTARQLMT
jgi:hypothetical protein